MGDVIWVIPAREEKDLENRETAMAVLASGVGRWSHPKRQHNVWDSLLNFVPFFRAKGASLYKEATYKYVQPSYFL